MTVSKSSPRAGRLAVWRSAIQLFHEYRRPPFVGPFRKLGFSYRVGALLLTSTGDERTPDVVASSESGWFCLDLTSHAASKATKLSLYLQIDPRYLAQYGLTQHSKPCDVMSGRATFVDDGENCQLILADTLQVLKENFVVNEALRVALSEANGTNLTLLPSIPVTLLPEMTTNEIRVGLVDIILQIFAPDSPGFTAAEIVDKGLERLAELVGPKDKSTLITKVEAQMRSAVDHLEGYLEYDHAVFRQSGEWREHPKTREYIVSRLNTWIGQGTSLADWW